MTTKRIVVNDTSDKSNTFLNIRPYSRLYCGYGGNTTNGLGTQNVWERFPYPSGGYAIWRNQDFTVDPSRSRFTYIGTTPRWFDLTATCNISKGSGAINQARTMEFQWRLNGVPIGVPRAFQMNTDISIVTGNGQVYLTNGDYIEPFFKNSENNDQALLTNCTFNLVEETDSVFIFE